MVVCRPRPAGLEPEMRLEIWGKGQARSESWKKRSTETEAGNKTAKLRPDVQLDDCAEISNRVEENTGEEVIAE